MASVFSEVEEILKLTFYALTSLSMLPAKMSCMHSSLRSSFRNLSRSTMGKLKNGIFVPETSEPNIILSGPTFRSIYLMDSRGATAVSK